MKKLYLLTAVSVLLGINNAYSAGYQLNEYSTTGLGRSFAGLGVVGDDFSAMGYNPAGMTLVKRSGFQLGFAATEIASKAKSEYGTDKMDYFVPLPSVMGQYNVNDKLFLGAGIYVPYGLSTKYKHNSHVATKSQGGVRHSTLEVIDTNISAAYKATDKLSLGASFVLRYIKGSLTSNVNKITMGGMTIPMPGLAYSDYRVKGWSTSWHLGAMYEFSENTRLGLAYRFKSTQKTKGKHYVNINDAYWNNPMFGPMIEALGFQKDNRFRTMSDPELPASWILSGYHRFNEKWGGSFTVKYVQWHRFYTFPGHSTMLGGTNLDVDYKWKDRWTFALGGEYYLDDKWTLRAGTAWDESPVPNSRYRTNRIPDTDRLWTSFGFSYSTGNHEIDFGYAHLFMMHGRTHNTKSGDLNVKYHSHSNMLALQYQYKF